ncbi:MAG: zinc-ribbon domain-containing protein [Promethearchaeota archaeon]
MAYFDDRKKKQEIAKERGKMKKRAIKAQKEYEREKARAELIKDERYVQRELTRVTAGLERAREKRDREIRDTLEHVGKTGDTFKCKVCGGEVEWDNLTCPQCGSLYCQYCGALMDQENPGQCPRCGGVPNYTPAPLVITTVESMPEEDRFWEQLNECPKCGAAVQDDWDECPICGAKLAGKGTAPAGPTTEAPKKVKKAMKGEEVPVAEEATPKKKKRRGL